MQIFPKILHGESAYSFRDASHSLKIVKGLVSCYLGALEVGAPQLGGEGGGQAVLQALETLSEPQRVGESEPGLQVQVEALLQPGWQGGRV